MCTWAAVQEALPQDRLPSGGHHPAHLGGLCHREPGILGRGGGQLCRRHDPVHHSSHASLLCAHCAPQVAHRWRLLLWPGNRSQEEIQVAIFKQTMDILCFNLVLYMYLVCHRKSHYNLDKLIFTSIKHIFQLTWWFLSDSWSFLLVQVHSCRIFFQLKWGISRQMEQWNGMQKKA